MSNVAHTFCSECGAPLGPGARACTTCGAAVGPGPGASLTGPARPSRAPGSRGSNAVIGIAAAIFVVLAVVAGVVAFVVIGGDEASADEVVLEPVAAATPDPFTESVAEGEDAGAADVARLEPSGSDSGAGEQVPGATPGLYGGTRDAATCDADQLVAFLQSNPDKAAAWAGVHGITVAEIPAYVAALTPVILTRDTRVTNHGFANGKATTVPAVLQAGTAVMVDEFGVPRVKCGCGNPLTEPTPVTTKTRYTGTRWSGFSISTVVVVNVTVRVEIFVLVDVADGDLYTRPPGTVGTDDGDLAVDDLCDMFPDDPRCTDASTSTQPTTPPETPPPATQPPATQPTTPPTTDPLSDIPHDTPTDRSSEAIGWINDAMVACDPSTSQYVSDMSASGSGTTYYVDVTITLDSGSWTASFLVDFATEDWPEITPSNSESAALICA